MGESIGVSVSMPPTCYLIYLSAIALDHRFFDFLEVFRNLL